LIKKYGTKYFLWSSINATRKKKLYVGSVLALSILYFPTIPFGIAYALTPKLETKFTFLLLDIEKSESVLFDSEKIDMNDSKALLNSRIYDLLFRIHSKR